MSAREMPIESELAFSLINSLSPHQQVAFAITILAMVADDNADNPELKGHYFHTGCKVQNAKNLLAAITNDHTDTCPKANEPGEIEA